MKRKFIASKELVDRLDSYDYDEMVKLAAVLKMLEEDGVTEEMIQKWGVHYKGKSISDILDMSVEEAYEFFKAVPSLERKLQTLIDVGMNYIKLGQPATTLSGGEAQRIKLATELSKISRGDTIYILDEPTTGLHFEDIRKLLIVLDRLVEKGNTVLVIEHNLDVIKFADYIIDVGPEGGHRGGQIIAKGTPEQIVKSKKSHTGKFLKKYL